MTLDVCVLMVGKARIVKLTEMSVLGALVYMDSAQ